MFNDPVPAEPPGGPGAVGMSKVFLGRIEEGGVGSGAGAGGSCTGVWVRLDCARCEVGAGVRLGLREGEGVVDGVGVVAGGGAGCDWTRAADGEGGNAEGGTDMLEAGVTIG
jgi:hypothetical protein